MEKALEWIKITVKERNKLVASISQVEIFSPGDVDWVVENWNPGASREGIKYGVFVVFENVFTQMTADDYIKQTHKAGKITVCHFKDGWLI